MIKRKITETIEEYDNNGKLKKKIITITEEDNSDSYYPQINTPIPNQQTIPYNPNQPYITWCTSDIEIKNEK